MKQPTRRRIAVTGATGLIGTALVEALCARGDEVVRFVRGGPARNPGEVAWDPAGGLIDADSVGRLDAIVNLAGAPVGQRWTAGHRDLILTSRLASTRLICRLIADMAQPCTLIGGSAVGIYGYDRGEEVLDENSLPGEGFLAEVVQAWESASMAATESGARVALARTGIVLSPSGGALGKVLPLAKVGLGGPLGTGRQFWPWITLEDEVRALVHLIDHDISGPVNVVAPEPARQSEVAGELGRALHRPAVVPAPAFALRAALGEFAEEILGSRHVVPAKLLATGFQFSHPTLHEAVAWLV